MMSQSKFALTGEKFNNHLKSKMFKTDEGLVYEPWATSACNVTSACNLRILGNPGIRRA